MATRPHASLAALARAYGGEHFAGGARALIPAPGHSAHDRSISLYLHNGRVLAHAFGAGDWREVLDDLRDRGWIDHDNRLLDGGAPAPPGRAPDESLTRAERVAVATRLWAEGGALVAGRPAARYVSRRAADLTLTDAGALRTHAAAPASAYRDRGPRQPALLAAVTAPDGRLTAVELTYLDQDGRCSSQARPARKLVGVLPGGSAVRLAPCGATMVVGEGVFTTLSAMRRFGLPGWALLSTGNLRQWTPPPGVRRVLVAGDRGRDGERSAALLAARLAVSGVPAGAVFPPAGLGDWNDLDQEEARRKGEAGRPDRGDGP